MAVLVVLALTGCGADDAGPSNSPPATSTAGTPQHSAGPQETTIPAAALLQAADLDGAAPEPAGDVAPYLRPPRPCGDQHPSEAARVASAAVTAAVTPETGQQGTPSVVLETIVRYRPGVGAQAYAELADALRRCPGQLGKDKRRWEIVGDVRAGDEAMVFKTTSQFEYGDETKLATVSTPVALARVGDDLVLLADLGWETASGEESKVRRLIVTAVERVRAAS
jgi:hypothetical protein